MIITLKLTDFPEKIQSLFNKIRKGKWNFWGKVDSFWDTISDLKHGKIPKRFPFRNDYKEKSHYEGTDVISFTGGKDSLAAAIISKIEQGVPPILATTFPTNDFAKKQAELLGSDIIEFPSGDIFYTMAYVLAPQVIDKIPDFSGRIILGGIVEEVTNLKYYPIWNESEQAFNKYMHTNYDANVDIINTVSSLSNSGTVLVCKTNEELSKYLVFDGGMRKKMYLKLITKARELQCINNKNFKYTKRKGLDAIRKDHRARFSENLKSAVYILSKGKIGKQCNWVDKINVINTFGSKSRERSDRIINELGLKYNKNVPKDFKRVIWK